MFTLAHKGLWEIETLTPGASQEILVNKPDGDLYSRYAVENDGPVGRSVYEVVVPTSGFVVEVTDPVSSFSATHYG